MTTIKETSGTQEKSIVFNRVMDGASVLLSLFFLAKEDASTAMSNLGIALIFDPFDQKIKWNDRPAYQRTWLFVHVGLVLALVIYLVLVNFNIV